MKIHLYNSRRTGLWPCEPPPPIQRRSETGMATVLFIALLGIMMVLVMVESRAVIRLHQQVKLMEQQQTKRLNTPATNAVPALPTP